MNSSSSESEKSEADMDIVTQRQLPANSREKYMKTYDNFMAWRNEKGHKKISQDLLLEYFKFLAQTKLPSTLWAVYSMLRATLHAHNGINIKTYCKLIAFLRRHNKGFKSKQSKVLSGAEIERFLKEAPDHKYLVTKVALIIGVHGSCHGGDLLNLRIQDIEKHSEQLLLVKLYDRNKGERSFVIRNEHKDIVDKYMALRPADEGTDRFFLRYHDGRCYRQVIGKNTMSSMPRAIAAFLKLPDPKLYTGHCFRRTAKALSGYTQTDLPTLRRREHDSSNVVREIFIADPHDNEAAIDLDALLNSGSTADTTNMGVPSVGQSDQANSDVLREVITLNHDGNEATVGIDTMLNPAPAMAATIKVEAPPSFPSWSGSLSPHLSESEEQDRELSPPPKKKERVHELQSGRIKITESITNSGETKTISTPTKNITIVFENCRNVSHININL